MRSPKNKSNSSWPHPKLSNSPPKEVILKCLFYHTYFFYHIFSRLPTTNSAASAVVQFKVGLGSTCLCIFFGEGRARIQDTNVFVLLLTAGISGIVAEGEDSQTGSVVHSCTSISSCRSWRGILNFGNSLPPQLSPRLLFKRGDGVPFRESIQNL